MKNEEMPKYRIAILGANGGIGKQAVAIALQEGHFVTAILRNPSNLEMTHPNLKIVQGDVMAPATLEKHLSDQDAVFSAIGKNSFKETTLYSEGNKNLLDAMKKSGINRAFFISASGLEVNPTHSFFVRFATKFILQKLLKNMYADIERMEKIVKQSSVNWTILRPPRLVDKDLTGKYRFAVNAILKNSLTVSRAEVAHFMIHHVSDPSTYKSTIEIGF